MLQLQEFFFESFFNQLPEPRIIIKADAPRFTIVACNNAYKIVSNTVDQDIIGKSMWELQPDFENADSSTIIRNALNKTIAKKEVVKLAAVQFDIADENGVKTGKTWWQAEYTPIIGNDGEVEYITCITNNITGQINSQQMLEKANQQENALKNELFLNEKLAVANEELSTTNEELLQSQESLALLNFELEKRVVSRTKALVESEIRFRSIFQQSPVGMALFRGREMITELANNNILKIWGRSREEVIDKPLRIARPELKDQPLLQCMDDAYTSGITIKKIETKGQVIYKGKLKEGYYNAVFQALKSANGTTTGILLILEDVTERVKTIQEIDRAQQQFNQAIDSARMGTWSVSPANQQLTLSDRSKELFGLFLTEEVLAGAAMKAIDEDYHQLVRNTIDIGLKQHLPCDIEYPITNLVSNERRWIRVTGKMFFDDNDQPTHYSGVMMDITERKLDDIRKNDFIAIVSHELKTPLTSLKAYVQMLILKAKKNEDEFTSVALGRVNAQVKKMTSMINSFLNVSRLEAGKIHLDKKDFLLDDLIREAISEISLTCNSHNIYLLPCETVSIHADYEKIGQVINNLLSNAIKYSPQGKQIEISCYCKDNMALVSVKDDGIGITQENIEKLFERFYRVDSKLTQVISGFGIGLYLCAEIIRRHDGKIGVESEIEKGSTFYFTLPII